MFSLIFEYFELRGKISSFKAGSPVFEYNWFHYVTHLYIYRYITFWTHTSVFGESSGVTSDFLRMSNANVEKYNIDWLIFVFDSPLDLISK